MKLQKQLSKKRGDKIYDKFAVVIPKDLVKKAGFKAGQELEGSAKKGEIKLRKSK